MKVQRYIALSILHSAKMKPVWCEDGFWCIECQVNCLASEYRQVIPVEQIHSLNPNCCRYLSSHPLIHKMCNAKSPLWRSYAHHLQPRSATLASYICVHEACFLQFLKQHSKNPKENPSKISKFKSSRSLQVILASKAPRSVAPLLGLRGLGWLVGALGATQGVCLFKETIWNNEANTKAQKI